MEVLPDEAMWAIVVGFLSPPVLAIIEQTKWAKWLRSVVAFAWSVVAGVGTIYFTGTFTGLKTVTVILLVFVTAISFYKGFWKPTGVAPQIESSSNVS